jgi:hypothetical protein
LGWLGTVVKELTGKLGMLSSFLCCWYWYRSLLLGDMQLTRDEINATHLIVTTPEKWDVVTRKSSGEEGLVSVS